MKITTTLTPANSALTISGSVLSLVTLLSKAGAPGAPGADGGGGEFYENFAAFPAEGEVDTTYVDKATGEAYIWSVDHYVSSTEAHEQDTTPHSTIHGINSIAPDLTPDLSGPFVVGERFWDEDNHCWATVARVEAGVITSLQQDGQELPMYWRNDDNVTHYNGQPVYVSGGTGKRAKVKLSSSATYSTATTIALATEDVTDGALGRYTTFGNVSDIPTGPIIASTDTFPDDWSEGADVYLSEEAGKLTVFPPEGFSEVVKIGNVTEIVGNSHVTIFFDPDNRTAHKCLENVRTDKKEPAGFPNRTDSAISFPSSASRTFSITATGETYDYWVKGGRFTEASNSVEHSTDTGLHFFYLDENKVLQTTTTPWDILDGYALVAIRYWNGTKGTQPGDERHGLRDLRLHARLHYGGGAVWDSQYNGGDLTVSGTAGDTWSLTQSRFFDEDIRHDTEGTLTTAHRWYGDGSSWQWDDNAVTTPYFSDGGVIQYYSTTSAALVTATQNYYVNVFLFHTNLGGTEKLAWVTGESQFLDRLDALQELPPVLPIGQECVCLHRLTYQAGVASTTYVSRTNWRGTQNKQLPTSVALYSQTFDIYAYPDQSTVTAGTASGTIGNLVLVDGSFYTITEAAGANPAIDVTLRVPVDGVVTAVNLTGRYTGAGAHQVDVGAVDSGANFDVLAQMPRSATTNSTITLPLDDSQHRYGGYVYIKLRHNSNLGIGSHQLILDQVRVEYAANGLQASRVSTTASGNLSGLTVEAQLQELDAEKVALANYIDWANPITYTPDAPYTLTVGKHYIFPDKSVPADYTVTLPAASGNAGKHISLEMSATLTKWVTVDGNASELIDLVLTRKMHDREFALLKCDGVGWVKIAGKSIPIFSSVKKGSAQTGIVEGIVTKITVDTVISDLNSIFDAANSNIVLPRTGLYTIRCFCNINQASKIDNITLYARNGTTIFDSLPSYAHASTFIGPQLIFDYQGTVGDTINMALYWSDSSLSANQETFANAPRLSIRENPTW